MALASTTQADIEQLRTLQNIVKEVSGTSERILYQLKGLEVRIMYDRMVFNDQATKSSVLTALSTAQARVQASSPKVAEAGGWKNLLVKKLDELIATLQAKGR